MVVIVIHTSNSQFKMQTLNTNPINEHDSHETSQVTYLHACRPNYYSTLLVMLYFQLLEI